MHRPPATAGMRHVALWVSDLEACKIFYCDLLGMEVEWQPDKENLYLTGGSDNVALHVAPRAFDPDAQQHLDHIGFILRKAEDVDAWYDFLVSNKVKIAKEPKTHRDGARSFYCFDPDGNVVQMIHHPPIADK